VLAAEQQLVPHYVLEVTRPGHLDELAVIVESRGSLAQTETEVLERRTEHLIKALVGVTTTVRVVPPGTVERSQGKAKRVIDKRPKG
jgi:phenylacetate-CoA ligase